MSERASTITSVKLLTAAVGMFVFAIFIMPPIYDMFCEITGIGGKTAGRYQAGQQLVDLDRVVKVQFITTNNGSMPWQFSPLDYELKVNPGASTAVEFYAKNPTSRDMVAQAIPSVSPTNAAAFFHKTQCFCFDQQVLKAGEETNLGLVFIIDPDLPRNINTITLSYTLFDVTERSAEALAQLD